MMSRVARLILLAMLVTGYAAAQQSSPAAGGKAGGADGPQLAGDIERVSDVQGADCGPYLAKVLETVRTNWLPLVPSEAKAPELKSGKGAVEFTIMPDGQVSGVKIISPSGDTAMDQAASEAIQKSQPFATLPSELHVPSLTLRFHFAYNPKRGDLPENTTKPRN